jgi:hypothetical protein
MLCKLFAMIDRFGVGFEVDSDPVPERNSIFHIKKEFFHLPHLKLLQRWNSSTRGDYRKGLPRLRALARMTVMERFSETAMLAGEAFIDQHRQVRGLGCCPLSASNAHHETQSVGSGFVPRRDRAQQNQDAKVPDGGHEIALAPFAEAS